MPSIVLLKLLTGGRDAYIEAFETAGWEVRTASPIEVEPLADGVQALDAAMRTPGAWGGLALTSPRAAVAAWRTGAGWSGPIWAVGEATAETARRIGADVRGASAGAAAALAERIVADAPEHPVLFPSGSRRRDALPRRLADAGIPVHAIEVYRTALRPGPLLDVAPDAVAFFSPSGVEAASADPAFPWTARLAAIGPTTAAALWASGHPADAIASVPTPDALRAALAPLA